MKRFIFLILLLIPGLHQNYFAQTNSAGLVAQLNSSLKTLVQLQKTVIDIHPCLKEFHPVAIPYKDSLLIFDYDTAKSEYRFVKETAQPFSLPEGIQASFPLSVYDNKPTSIVNQSTFTNPSGYTTVMHEFIHCCQFNSVESELKKSLEIYNEAMKKKNYSWEIMHPFPYGDSVFIDYYNKFKASLDKNDIQSAKLYRDKIKSYLSRTDFEYMLWEEWKEGLARYVENKINERLNIKRNDYGRNEPYNRVSFYYSGELLISRLAESNPALPEDIKLLFEGMRDF